MKVDIDYFDEIPLCIEGDFHPQEQATHDYPGRDAWFNIHFIYLNDVDIYELVGNRQEEIIQQLVLNKLESYG
jgi:hypothetical protein